MHFASYLFITRQIDKLDARMALLRSQDRVRQAGMKQRIEALERDLGRVALVTRALADVCVAKGLFTQEQLVRQIHDVDALDGVLDQRLSADVVLPGQSKPPPPPAPPARAKKAKRKRPYP